MHFRRLATHLELSAPAKINLFLEVLARRTDGYHEINTVLSAIRIFDTVEFVATDNPEIVLECRWAHGLAAQDAAAARPQVPAQELALDPIPLGPKNLAWQAAQLIRNRSGISLGARISLIKRIPAAAGLGGASSDAAAVLRAANLAWRLNWPHEKLVAVAAELGSDIPFFLASGSAVATGRGERLSAVRLPPLHVVIVKPPVGLSTPRVYAACQPRAAATGTDALLKLLAAGKSAQAAQHLVNDLQPPAARLTPWIEKLRHAFERQPVLGHQMSGSGSSYFALCRSARQARRLAATLRARDVGWVRYTTTAVSN